jgi:hypothetical protein
MSELLLVNVVPPLCLARPMATSSPCHDVMAVSVVATTSTWPCLTKSFTSSLHWPHRRVGPRLEHRKAYTILDSDCCNHTITMSPSSSHWTTTRSSSASLSVSKCPHWVAVVIPYPHRAAGLLASASPCSPSPLSTTASHCWWATRAQGLCSSLLSLFLPDNSLCALSSHYRRVAPPLSPFCDDCDHVVPLHRCLEAPTRWLLHFHH